MVLSFGLPMAEVAGQFFSYGVTTSPSPPHKHKCEKQVNMKMFQNVTCTTLLQSTPFFLGRGEKPALWHFKVIAILDPIFSDEIPFCFFEVTFCSTFSIDFN